MQTIFKECLTLDERVRDRYQLSSEVMMEHAALGIKEVMRARRAANKRYQSVLILCGPGDNGADGYALARLIMQEYKVIILSLYSPLSKMAQKQKDRALKLGITLIDSDPLSALMDLPVVDIYVDALFGASQHHELSGDLEQLLNTLNGREGLKIACDMPTGLYSMPFKADITVTMGALKQDLLMDSVKDSVGEIIVADLGVPRSLYETDTNTYLLEESDLQLPFRSLDDSNKGNYGFLSVIKGEQMGASILSSLAGTRFGAGIVALVGQGDKPSEIMQMADLSDKTTAIALGMGLGNHIHSLELKKIRDYPLVVDADLLYEKTFIKALKNKEDVIFTPHPKEFSALLHNAGINDAHTYSITDIQANRFELARDFSQQYRGVLILKGANTLIAHQGVVYVCNLGTNRLAKGGSGDVLAGMVGALLAQGYEPLHCAIQAVLAHSLVAKYSTIHDFAFTPLDLIEGLKSLSFQERTSNTLEIL